MPYKFKPFAILLVMASLAVAVTAQPPPSFTNERFVVRAMSMLSNAQATYHATVGDGNYGTLAQLRDAHLIDETMATGSMYGYRFTVTLAQSSFTVSAVPVRYRKTGRWSYFIDQHGLLYGGDRTGGPVTSSDGTYVDSCAFYGIRPGENCTINALRTLHGAQMTYAATVGNGEYANVLGTLYAAGLIDVVLALGTKHGYQFQMSAQPAPQASFRISVVPVTYGVTGVRSFFLDENGVIRGADRAGGPARSDDPPID